MTEDKKEETVLARRLVNPSHVSTYFTGKVLEIKPLDDVRKFFANQSISVRGMIEMHMAHWFPTDGVKLILM